MDGAKASIWAGFDVGKASFSAALDQLAENGRAKVTTLPCRDFKRTPEGVEQFFQWAKKAVPDHEFRIVMETTGCYSQHLTDWINLLHPEVGITIENARNIHAFIQSLNLPHKTDKLDAQAIARFGTERQPKSTKRPSKTLLTIRELSRTALIKARVDLQNRRDTLPSPIVRKINAHSCRNRFTETIFSKGTFLIIRVGATNHTIWFKLTFFFLEQKIVGAAAANSLPGFRYRSSQDSVSSGISSASDRQRQEENDLEGA